MDNSWEDPAVVEKYQSKEKTLQKLGRLVLDSYTDGRISQQDHVDMLEVINHFSLKDYIKPSRKEKNGRTESISNGNAETERTN